jgi:hypothetical protein
MDTESSPSSQTSSNTNTVPLILTFCAISALLIFLIYSQNIVFGSKAGLWTYPYFRTITSIPLWIPLSVLLLLGLFIFFGSKLIVVYEKTTLVAGFFVTFCVQSLINSVYPISIGRIVLSDLANSFYTPAMHFSPLEILSQFGKLAPSFPWHARTNMPGKILLFQFFSLFTSNPRITGYLVILLSTFGGLLLYGICKKLFNDKQTALYALILYTLIPCKLFFFPIPNTATPVFILLCLYLFLVYIEKKQILFLWLLGGSFYLLILFEPTPLVTGLIFIGILLHAIGEKRFSKMDFWRLLIFPTLAFLAVYLFFLVVFSFNLLHTLQYVFRDAVGFNSRENRSYWIWAAENPKEFFYGAGIPIMIIFIYLSARILSQWKTLKFNITKWSMENIYILSLMVTLCLVVFLGINRGEITRLWIFLAVFFQVPAAFFLAKTENSKVMFFLVASTLVIQSLVTLQRVSFIIP